MQIHQLNRQTRSHISEVGGKCAGLLHLIQLEMPVPNAFVVAAPVYADYAKRCSLNDKLFPLIEQHDWTGVERTARETLENTPLDEAFCADLLDHYKRLKTPAVAVRSSATSEDQKAASCAGQYETYLNVQGEQHLLAAVRGCWASLWSRRALAYRQQRGIDHLAAQMAVIIQAMVPAQAAGVLFTRDPLMQDPECLQIEIVPGLGDALVSGKITGEMIKIHRRTLACTGGKKGFKGLDSEVLKNLCAMALRVEAHLGLAQDIEFAIADKSVYLLQTRPMTALDTSMPEPLEPLGKPSRLDKMIKPFADERYVVAPKPLDNLVVTRLIGGHLYAIKESGAVVKEKDEKALLSQIWRQAYRMPPVHRLWKLYVYGVPLVFSQLKTDWLQWWQSGPGQALQTVSRFRDVSAMDDKTLFDRAEELLSVWETYLYKRMSAAGGVHALPLLQWVVSVVVGPKKSGQIMADLMAGIETPTLALNEELWQLSRLARRSPEILAAVRETAPHRLEKTAEGRRFLESVASFIHRHGHREGSCWYLTTPTWRQDPMQVWRLLSCLVDAGQRTGNPEQAGARNRAALALVEKRLRYIPGLRHAFRWLWRHLYRLNAFREKSHYDLTRPLDALQAISHEWGRRLVERGLLESETDIGYLTGPEIHAWLCKTPPTIEYVRTLLARRRATYRLVNANWQSQRAEGVVRRNGLKGIAASPGITRGNVRIIRGEHEFGNLLSGEVLVCPYTNPAWTPLFATAAAVVTETGGLASHAAIVAREYGIPAVMGIAGATLTLKQGREVLVDGTRGIVSESQNEDTLP